MLSLGLRARRTPCRLLAVTHPIHFTRHLTRWPPRRSRTPLFRFDVAGGARQGARSFAAYSIAVAFGAGVGFIAYENYQPFRHTVLAAVRCSRVASE
jgi:aarF domain-containing kinase